MLDYIRTLRSLIGNTKVIIPGVRALIFNDDGELLLQKQRVFDSWSLPHGCIDVGESVLDALIREVKEETAISVDLAEPFGIYSDPRYSVTYPNGDEVQTFTVAFVVRQWHGQPAADLEESTEVKFFPLHDLPSPIYPIHLDTIRDYMATPGRFIVR